MENPFDYLTLPYPHPDTRHQTIELLFDRCMLTFLFGEQVSAQADPEGFYATFLEAFEAMVKKKITIQSMESMEGLGEESGFLIQNMMEHRMKYIRILEEFVESRKNIFPLKRKKEDGH